MVMLNLSGTKVYISGDGYDDWLEQTRHVRRGKPDNDRISIGEFPGIPIPRVGETLFDTYEVVGVNYLRAQIDKIVPITAEPGTKPEKEDHPQPFVEGVVLETRLLEQDEKG